MWTFPARVTRQRILGRIQGFIKSRKVIDCSLRGNLCGILFFFFFQPCRNRKKNTWAILSNRAIRGRLSVPVGVRSLTVGWTLLKYYSTHTHPKPSLNTEAPAVKARALGDANGCKDEGICLRQAIYITTCGPRWTTLTSTSCVQAPLCWPFIIPQEGGQSPLQTHTLTPRFTITRQQPRLHICQGDV